MHAASQGAKIVGGVTLGILPTPNSDNVSPAVDIIICTDLGNARNNLNVLSSQVLIACGMGIGTASEIALGLKAGKPVILLNNDPHSQVFFQSLAPDQIFIVDNPGQAVQLTAALLATHVSSLCCPEN
jgi:uncharacterized protein (TIGR00725 family)